MIFNSLAMIICACKMHRTGSFYALLMCGLLNATTEWIGGDRKRMKEKERLEMALDPVDWVLVVTSDCWLFVYIDTLSLDCIFSFVFFSHWISQQKLSTWARICYRFRERKKYGIYINANSSTANGFILPLYLFYSHWNVRNIALTWQKAHSMPYTAI